jgi:tetrathionate reductase subunit A
VASEFSSYGTKAAVTAYHGAGNYVSGTYAAYAVAVLNALVGSVNMRGGYLTGGGGAGSPKSSLYDLITFPKRINAKGVAISREKAAYEKSTEYRIKKAKNGSGYPAARPWFPFSKGGLSVEALSGIDHQYPYPCKILFTYLFNPIYSIPGGYRFKQTLKDSTKVPLHVSMDIAVNESNIYADYIVPELSYAEGHYGWLTPHAPAMKFTGLRTPMIRPVSGATEDGRPFCTETFLIDLAQACGLAGFGKEAIPGKDSNVYPLHRAEDFYLRAFANIAQNAKVPNASPEDRTFVEQNYPVAKIRDILPEKQWSKVCYMLARGGVFRPYEQGFDNEEFRYGIKRVAVYNEDLASTVNSLTGKRFPGTLAYMPPVDAAGRRLEELDALYPFTVVTYKKNLHTQSRSLWCSYALEVMPENFVQMNETDAKKAGIQENDRVRLISKSQLRGVEGRVQLTRLIRPGCVGVSFHYGHTQFGASRLEVKKASCVFQGAEAVTDQHGLIPNPGFSAGLNPNDVARLDDNLGNTPLVDLVGGIPDFSSTRVKVVKL